MLQICPIGQLPSIGFKDASIIEKNKLSNQIWQVCEKGIANNSTYLIVKLLKLNVTHGNLALLSRHILHQL